MPGIHTPRFSYVGPETAICTCPAGTTPRGSPGTAPTAGRVGIPGGYTGWVGRGAIPGYYRGTTQRPRKVPYPAERAPEALAGAGVGGIWDRPRERPLTTPAGPGRVLGTLPVSSSSNAASGPIRARFHVKSSKVSQNGIVSPRNVEKACHSPYFQNGLQKSPLDISRISILASLLSQGINGPF